LTINLCGDNIVAKTFAEGNGSQLERLREILSFVAMFKAGTQR